MKTDASKWQISVIILAAMTTISHAELLLYVEEIISKVAKCMIGKVTK